MGEVQKERKNDSKTPFGSEKTNATRSVGTLCIGGPIGNTYIGPGWMGSFRGNPRPSDCYTIILGKLKNNKWNGRPLTNIPRSVRTKFSSSIWTLFIFSISIQSTFPLSSSSFEEGSLFFLFCSSHIAYYSLITSQRPNHPQLLHLTDFSLSTNNVSSTFMEICP